MQLNKFTIREQEAIQEAIRRVQDFNHQQVDSDHLLLSLLRQGDSIIPSLLEKLGLDIYALIRKAEERLKNKITVQGKN